MKIEDLNLVLPKSWDEINTKKGIALMKVVTKFNGGIDVTDLNQVIELLSVLSERSIEDFYEVPFMETLEYIQNLDLSWLAEVK
jgi:hypothetical protein